ncbi:uncharacterized protein LOC143037325 [Oratosquilla oratoria]|uniref:uncharacterized protein LOC143037325 n=1 Tax=Oratosquilla oratoria TaxID=337810 RepID=UPI003F7651F2
MIFVDLAKAFDTVNRTLLWEIPSVTAEALHELHYVDDNAFVSSSPNGLQRAINAVSEAYSRSGLAINVQKMEVLNMCQSPAPEFLINNQPLRNVKEFTYLGSVLSSTNDLTSEVQRRIGLASATFGRLSYRVFMNRDLTITTKMYIKRSAYL